MLWKKTTWLWKRGLAAISLVFILSISGCGSISPKETEESETHDRSQDVKDDADETITLTANVVYPYSGNSKVNAHEVVIRPFEDGGVQYVSNKIYPSGDNCEETWHTPRLTEEEWEKLYGGE